jgi:hypothetical protein
MMLLASITNWEPHGVTLAGYCYAMRHRMRVQIATPFCVSQLQCYDIIVCGNITSVYPPLEQHASCIFSSQIKLAGSFVMLEPINQTAQHQFLEDSL